jgi:hypothetical protein
VTYLVESTATDADGSATEIQAYVTGTSVCSDYSGILNQIITSQGEIDLNKVTLNCSEEHEPNDHYKGAWPETQQEITQFCQWYLLNVSDVEPYDSDIVDLAGDSRQLERLRRVGPLELLNSVNHPATLALNGTLYITGDTLIGAQGHDFTLDLNRQTIFVESSSAGPDKALWIGGKCTIKGPGIIIALGDIYFEPNPDVGGESEPVFVMSVAGTTTIRPGVSMYGAVAGSIEVGVQQGSKPIINYPEGGFGDLNFPGLLPPKLVYRVDSWEVSRASRQED